MLIHLSSYQEFKERLLVCEAERWVGVTEVGGNNRGQLISLFQKAVDNLAVDEPWCLAFIQYCVKNIDRYWDAMFQSTVDSHTKLYPTEHCLTLWNRMSFDQKSSNPSPGMIAVWNYQKDGLLTSAGHVGIVVETIDQDTIITIEGNTGASRALMREGDGVYKKTRRYKEDKNLVFLGFISCW